MTLAWWAGPWAHKYDVFLGTTPANLVKIVADSELGPSESSADHVTWTVNGLSPGTTYYWKVVGRTMANLARTSKVASFRTASEAGPLPASAALPDGWSSEDVGSVGVPGSGDHAEGTFTVSGSGADVWGTSDELQFVSRTLTGDGTIVARVTAVDAVDPWAKVGVMIRESVSAASAHAFMLVSPGRGLAFQRRVSAGGVSTNTGGGSGTAPAWVRLTRTGHVVTAYRSVDGLTWTPVGSETIVMAATVHVGLAVSSHRDGQSASASFQHVVVSP